MKGDEEDKSGGPETHDRKLRGRNKQRKEGKFKRQLPSKRQHGTQSESNLIGHYYLEKCKVGLDSAGYLQTKRHYISLIGSTRALLINQNENRHQEHRKRQGGEEEEIDGWRKTSKRKMRFLQAEVSALERGLPFSITSYTILFLILISLNVLRSLDLLFLVELAFTVLGITAMSCFDIEKHSNECMILGKDSNVLSTIFRMICGVTDLSTGCPTDIKL